MTAMLTRAERATAQDAGCWVDGVRGWRAVGFMIARAQDMGMTLTPREEHALAAFDADHRRFARSDIAEAHDIVEDYLAARAEAWMNDHIAPDGFAFGWHDGDFSLLPKEA